MKLLRALLFFSLIVFPVAAHAQGSSDGRLPYAEIFTGYSYLNSDLYGLSSDRQHAHGWKAAVSTPLTSYLALDYEVSGDYKSLRVEVNDMPVQTVRFNVKNYAIFFGPRFTRGPVFAHIMIGGDCLAGRALGVSKSEWSLAGAFGGGVQFPISKLMSFRATADYEVAKHELFGMPEQTDGPFTYTPSLSQNNIRMSAGVVFNVGHK